MTFANKRHCRRKGKGAILQTATEHIMGTIEGPYYWGEHIYGILLRIWGLAFERGYLKGRLDMEKQVNEDEARRAACVKARADGV